MRSQLVKFIAGWTIALGLLFAVVYYTFNLSDISEFLILAKNAKPIWLLAMVASEIGTYVCTAFIFHSLLKAANHHPKHLKLLPLSVQKLAIDQFIPTAGVGGSALVVQGLRRSGASRKEAIGMVVISLAAWYLAGDLSGIFGLFMVSGDSVIFTGALGIFAIYLLISFVIIFFSFKAIRTRWFEKLKNRLPFKGLRTFLEEMSETRDLKLVTSSRFLGIVLWHVIIILLDTATLYFAFLALGAYVPFTQALAVYALANMAATITVLPGGVGVFEGGSVAVFALLGVNPATALAATVLYRGFSVWLPVIPGLLLARKEIQQAYSQT